MRRLYGLLQRFCKWGLERGDFGQAYWVGFVQPTLLTSSLLKEEKSTVTMWKPVLEPKLWLGSRPKHNFSTVFQVLLEVTVLCYNAIACIHVFLSKAQEKGLSLSFLNCAGPGSKQMRLNLTHQWGAWWDHSHRLWKPMFRAASVGKLWSLEFFVFPHWLRNYLLHHV